MAENETPPPHPPEPSDRSPSGAPAGAGLEHIETWIFDLDNTLYPSTAELFAEVDQRMGEFIAGLLDLDYAEARKLQKHYFREYGTTLRGLMNHHDVDPRAFLDHVHQVDVSRLTPDARLGTVLEKLDGTRIIFTNSTVRHTHSVLTRLGIADRFHHVHDIVAAAFLPKPDPRAYRDLVRQYDVDPTKAVLFEDVPRNLEPAHALGMTTVLVKSHHEWSQMGDDGPHIHHVTDDLAAWLDARIPDPA